MREKDPIAAVRAAGLDPLAVAGLVLGQKPEERTPEQVTADRLGTLESELKQLREQNANYVRAEEERRYVAELTAAAQQAGDSAGIVVALLAENPGYSQHLRQQIEERQISNREDLKALFAEESERQTAQYVAAVQKLLTIPYAREKILAIVRDGPADAAPSTKERPKTIRGAQQAQEPTDRRSRPITETERIAAARERLRAGLKKAK